MSENTFSNDGVKRRRINSNSSDPTSFPGPHLSSAAVAADAHQPWDAVARSLFPAEVLAHILNYMLYGDVRKSLLAGRIMAFDAARKITTLNITKAKQLNLMAARNRFPNVEEVNVFSLYKFHIEEEDDDDGDTSSDDDEFEQRYDFSTETALTVVFFLELFPSLKRVWIGGAKSDDGTFDRGFVNFYYDCKQSFGQRYLEANHQDVMKSLVLQLCGAFRSGALSQKLSLGGILPGKSGAYAATYECKDAEESGADRFSKCTMCQQVCQTFPFRKIISRMVNYSSYCFSQSESKVLDIIEKRPGGLEYLASNEFLESLIRNNHCYFNVQGDYFRKAEKNTQERFFAKGYSSELYFFEADMINLIRQVSEKFGIRWIVSKEVFDNALFLYRSPHRRYLMHAATYVNLISAGISGVDLVFDPVHKDSDLEKLIEG